MERKCEQQADKILALTQKLEDGTMSSDHQVKQLTNRLEEAEMSLKRERSARQELEEERVRLERELGSLRVTRAGDTADITVLRDQIGKLDDSLAAEKLKNS